MRHERFSLLPGSACTSPHPHGARAAFVLVQRWYVARNHESGSSVSAPPGASVARPARIAEPTPVSASALRRKLSYPSSSQLSTHRPGYAPSWRRGAYLVRGPSNRSFRQNLHDYMQKTKYIRRAYFLVRASHARLFGACGCVSGREAPFKRNETGLFSVSKVVLLCNHLRAPLPVGLRTVGRSTRARAPSLRPDGERSGERGRRED